MSVHEDLLNNGENNCSFTEDEVDIMCSKDGDDACGDSRVDVKGKIGITVKRLEIKGFKTKGSIFECCLMPGEKMLMETYPESKNGRVVATLLI